jgi:hypothetical protein
VVRTHSLDKLLEKHCYKSACAFLRVYTTYVIASCDKNCVVKLCTFNMFIHFSDLPHSSSIASVFSPTKFIANEKNCKLLVAVN